MAKKLVCSRLPNGLFYSDDDIGGLYRESSDKIEQVKILCELNLCKPPEIIDALKRCGYKKSELPIVTKVKSKSQNPLFKNRFSSGIPISLESASIKSSFAVDSYK